MAKEYIQGKVFHFSTLIEQSLSECIYRIIKVTFKLATF